MPCSHAAQRSADLHQTGHAERCGQEQLSDPEPDVETLSDALCGMEPRAVVVIVPPAHALRRSPARFRRTVYRGQHHDDGAGANPVSETSFPSGASASATVTRQKRSANSPG